MSLEGKYSPPTAEVHEAGDSEEKSLSSENDEKKVAGEKLDELTSLEREIAEMHHAEAKRVNVADSSGEDDEVQHSDKILLEMQPASRNVTPAVAQNDVLQPENCEVASSVDSLEREDLIALLLGNEEDTPLPEGPSSTAKLEVEGVTIEGEGEFQIMEIVDDENEELVSLKPELTTKAAPATRLTVVKTYGNSKTKLTREEERAMAMEQMAGLQARVDRQRRRKQEIKSLKAETPDLVSSITAEWSDDDTVTNEQEPSKAENRPSPVREEAAPSASKPSSAVEPINKSLNSPDDASTETDVDSTATATVTAAVAVNIPPQTTGFKRTRIIKRKIIWDPDAPETNISYAQHVRSKAKPETTVSAQKTSPLAKREPAPPASKKLRPTTPKEQKASTVSPVVIVTQVQSPDDDAATSKRRSQTPVANGSSKKKKVSEIDRLMSDEGAINMLISLENDRNKLGAEKDGEKSPRPLMRSRAGTVSERVTKPPTPTPKKDSPGAGGTTSVAVAKGKRVVAKSKPSATWDYVYQQQASEDAMIIRRRSNSSYSSTASQHRLSVDAPSPPATAATKAKTLAKSAGNTAQLDDETAPSPTTAKSASRAKTPNTLKQNAAKAFEFARPESKQQQTGSNRRAKSPTATQTATTADALASDMKKNAAGAQKSRTGAVRSPANEDEKPSGKATSSASKDPPTTPTAEVLVKRVAKIAQIIFSTHKSKQDFTFTAQLMNKLVQTLDKLRNDSSCHAVVIITSAPHFCQGVDFTELTVGSAEKRKIAASLLAISTKNYLTTLATFPKPLIAGVSGNIMGLGVTQLPLYDVVIASDKTTYEAPYAKIGQVPEGFCIWNNLSKIRGTLKTKLFWLCEKLHATESALAGLVNKLTAANRVNEDAVLVGKKIGSMSQETYRVMKMTTIQPHLDTIVIALDDEFDTIARQWTSAECLDSFRKYLELGHY